MRYVLWYRISVCLPLFFYFLLTINDVLRVTTLDYLNGLTPQAPPDPDQIEEDLLKSMRAAFDLENAMRAKNDQLKCPQKLEPAQIATVMAALYPICTVQTGGTGSDRP